MEFRPLLSLGLVLLVSGGAIYYLEANKPGRGKEVANVAIDQKDEPLAADKAKQYVAAKELAQPAGFINTEAFKLKDLIGHQVILVDFWTYSCINCQRTLPYLNAWQQKYKDAGLTIVGVHTPEFGFEKEVANVQAAVTKYDITYPVVLDNDYATWRAYKNQYWPRKYLIDIDGYIVYDHIGEGAYEETEQKIQELLQERANRLHTTPSIATDISRPQNAIAADASVASPEVYFGSKRNELLSNGTAGQVGEQNFVAPSTIPFNKLFLAGQWDMQPEYATNKTTPASILFRYKAKNVYMVASAEEPVTLTIKQDGVELANKVIIEADQLYYLLEDTVVGEHTLELIPNKPGLKAFTFTFG